MELLETLLQLRRNYKFNTLIIKYLSNFVISGRIENYFS